MASNPLLFSVPELIWFFDTNEGAGPNPNPTPLPGVTTLDEGEGLYTIEVTRPDTTTFEVEHVGAQEPAVDPDPSPSVIWIEKRSSEGGDLGG